MSGQRTAARAFALLVLGAVCIGFAPLLVRVADVGPVASAFWRMALATPVLWLVVRWLERGAGRWRRRTCRQANDRQCKTVRVRCDRQRRLLRR
jgi:hypothetical protein